MEDTIKICSSYRHDEQVPLIWTFAFNYKEYWCPACGATYGMMGAGDNVPWSFALNNKLVRYKEKSRKFLHEKGLQICARTKYKGQMMTFYEMPERARKYWINQSKKWKYKYS